MSEKKKWFEYAGDDSDVIVSTRVSLSRNLKGRPFVWRMRAEEREEVLGEILAAVGNDTGLDSGNNIPRNLDVGGNKTPVEESVAALYNELFHSCASLRAY